MTQESSMDQSERWSKALLAAADKCRDNWKAARNECFSKNAIENVTIEKMENPFLWQLTFTRFDKVREIREVFDAKDPYYRVDQSRGDANFEVDAISYFIYLANDVYHEMDINK